MKKSVKVFALMMIGFMGFTAHAQIFGVKGGVGLANITSPTESVDGLYGRTLGAKLGATIEFDITDEFYVGSGLSFAKKGGSTAGDNFNLFYIELPISARYSIFEIGGSGEFFVASGFYLATPISAKIGDAKFDIGTDVKSLDFGMNGGLGVIFDERFEVGIQYEGGFLDLSGNENTVLKNVAILLSFGYKFGM